MRAILDSRFWILDSVARTFLSAQAVAIVCLTAACSSAPRYPEPQGDSGQILVRLQGEPKEGVKGPRTSEVREDYSISRESVEKGKAFERVDYDELEDVVVMVPEGGALLESQELTVSADGFSRQQVAFGIAKHPVNVTLHVKNTLNGRLTLIAVPREDYGRLREITVPASGDSKLFFSSHETQYGSLTFDLYCEQHEDFHCVVYVVNGGVWIGNSSQAAFFDFVPPGEHTVTVYPPRLPPWSRKVTVTAGKRTAVTAELTVNTLPKVGK